MRLLVLVVCLAACDLPLPTSGGDDDTQPPNCPEPAPPGSCECTSTIGWACTTCPFGEGRGAVPCSEPGRTCQIETWEHGCGCTCGSDGWWSCFEETIGSRCPQGMPDAGVPDMPLDAAIDAGPCQSIEAENIGVHPGWAITYGPPSGGKGLGAGVANASFTFGFTGTAFDVTYIRGPVYHAFSVVVDARPPVMVDANGSGNYTWITSTVASGLANAAHTVTVTCITPSCGIDVFPVRCN